jgi:hypothetical protein
MAANRPVSACGAGHGPAARFRFNSPAGPQERCLRHAILYPQLVRTALATALVVGTILTAINQGTVLADGHFPGALAWKVPLTYCVPYCVATFSAVRLARVARA